VAMRLLMGTRKINVSTITAAQIALALIRRGMPGPSRRTNISMRKSTKLTTYQTGMAAPSFPANRLIARACAPASSFHKTGLMDIDTANSVPINNPMHTVVIVSKKISILPRPHFWMQVKLNRFKDHPSESL
jgi:hypothetical protein